MAVVVFLKGVNVGGHRRVRPSLLAKQLKRFDVASIGAAGTFVVRKAVAAADLRREILRRLPFDAEVIVCSGVEILRLVRDDPFGGGTPGRDIVSFVGVPATRRRSSSPVPRTFPAEGEWCVRVLERRGRFVLGRYRRRMRTISCLGQLEKALGTSLAIRNWTTIVAIGNTLTPAAVRRHDGP